MDIINSTLGKALGGAMGGYTAGPKEVVQLLRQKARPYLFSNTLPPAVVGSALAVFDMLLEDNSLVKKVSIVVFVCGLTRACVYRMYFSSLCCVVHTFGFCAVITPLCV